MSPELQADSLPLSHQEKPSYLWAEKITVFHRVIVRIKWVKICKVFRRVSDLFSCPFSNIVNKHTCTQTHMKSSSSYLSSDEREKDIASWLIMWKLPFIPCLVHYTSKSQDTHRACEIRAVSRGGSPATWGFSFLSRHWDEVQEPAVSCDHLPGLDPWAEFSGAQTWG